MKPVALASFALILTVAACSDSIGAADSDLSDASDASEDAPDATADLADAAADAAPDVAGRDVPPSWFDGRFGGADIAPPVEACTDGVDNDDDGRTDCADDECGGRLICAAGLANEIEPNERAADGQLLALPLTVGGVVSEFTTNEEGAFIEDRDWFQFVLPAPGVVSITIDDANGLGLFQVWLAGVDDATEGIIRRLDINTPGATREAYLHAAGQYAIEVRDYRNTRRTSEELPYGGAGFDYALSVEGATLAPEAVELPFDSGVVDDGENRVRAFDVDVPAGRVLEAQALAERLSPASEMDTWLLLIDPQDGALMAQSDDAPLSTNDSVVRTGLLEEPTAIRIVVDAFSFVGGGRHQLIAESDVPAIDREPNGPIALAYPAVEEFELQGTIDEPVLRFTTRVADIDYYVLPGGRSASYLVEVEPTGDELNAGVRTGFRSSSRGNLFLSEVFTSDPADDVAVRLEVTSLFDRSVFLQVSARENLFDAEIPPVGGEEYGYELRVTPISRSLPVVELPFERDGDLGRLGEVDWYEATVPAMSRIDLSVASAGDDTEGIDLWVYLSRAANDAYLRRASGVLYYLNPVESTYRFAVLDRSGGGGPDYSYTVVADAPAFSLVESSELTGVGPWWAVGTVSGENIDSFEADVFTVELEAGDVIHIETDTGTDPEADNADTFLTFGGPGFPEPPTDDDAGVGRFSRLTDIEITESGTFEITVRPDCNEDSCPGGAYSLVVWLQDDA